MESDEGGVRVEEAENAAESFGASGTAAGLATSSRIPTSELLESGDQHATLTVPGDAMPRSVESLPESAISISTDTDLSGNSETLASSNEGEQGAPGGIVPTDLDAATAANPPFPSPSSSFRPQPDLNITDGLDERIAAMKLSRSEKRQAERQGRSQDRVSDRAPTEAKASRSRSREANSSRRSRSFPRTNTMSTNASFGQTGEEIRIIVRDYAFPRDDPRFHGEAHPDELDRRDRFPSSHQPSPLGNETFASSGSSAYSWGFVTTHADDFAGSDSSQPYSEDMQHFEEEYGDFVPGIYKALYEFEPELESEMALAVDELVIVSMRQCAGWVQANRIAEGELTGEMGLVPENYLTLVARDDSFAVQYDDGQHEQPLHDVPVDEPGVDSEPVAAEAREDDPTTPKGLKTSNHVVAEEHSTPSKTATTNTTDTAH